MMEENVKTNIKGEINGKDLIEHRFTRIEHISRRCTPNPISYDLRNKSTRILSGDCYLKYYMEASFQRRNKKERTHGRPF